MFGQQAVLGKVRLATAAPPHQTQTEKGEVTLWCRRCISAASGPSPLASCDRQAIVLEGFSHLPLKIFLDSCIPSVKPHLDKRFANGKKKNSIMHCQNTQLAHHHDSQPRFLCFWAAQSPGFLLFLP